MNYTNYLTRVIHFREEFLFFSFLFLSSELCYSWTLSCLNFWCSLSPYLHFCNFWWQFLLVEFSGVFCLQQFLLCYVVDFLLPFLRLQVVRIWRQILTYIRKIIWTWNRPAGSRMRRNVIIIIIIIIIISWLFTFIGRYLNVWLCWLLTRRPSMDICALFKKYPDWPQYIK